MLQNQVARKGVAMEVFHPNEWRIDTAFVLQIGISGCGAWISLKGEVEGCVWSFCEGGSSLFKLRKFYGHTEFKRCCQIAPR